MNWQNTDKHSCCELFFFFSSRRRHTRYWRDWSSDVCSSDLDVAIPFTRRSDEIGCMAQAVNVLRDNLSDGRRLASQQEGERAKREERARHIEELVHGFDRQSGQALDAVSSASSALLQSADNLSTATREAQERAGNVASGATEAAANVQTG